jgi:hypothetical protein
MNNFPKYITGIASIVTVFTVLQFEKQTGLSSAWERPENRKLIESRLTLNHTGLRDGKPVFFENAFTANVREISNYSGQYQCASGKDVSKCRTSSTSQEASVN